MGDDNIPNPADGAKSSFSIEVLSVENGASLSQLKGDQLNFALQRIFAAEGISLQRGFQDLIEREAIRARFRDGAFPELLFLATWMRAAGNILPVVAAAKASNAMTVSFPRRTRAVRAADETADADQLVYISAGENRRLMGFDQLRAARPGAAAPTAADMRPKIVATNFFVEAGVPFENRAVGLGRVLFSEPEKLRRSYLAWQHYERYWQEWPASIILAMSTNQHAALTARTGPLNAQTRHDQSTEIDHRRLALLYCATHHPLLGLGGPADSFGAADFPITLVESEERRAAREAYQAAYRESVASSWRTKNEFETSRLKIYRQKLHRDVAAAAVEKHLSKKEIIELGGMAKLAAASTKAMIESIKNPAKRRDIENEIKFRLESFEATLAPVRCEHRSMVAELRSGSMLSEERRRLFERVRQLAKPGGPGRASAEADESPLCRLCDRVLWCRHVETLVQSRLESWSAEKIAAKLEPFSNRGRAEFTFCRICGEQLSKSKLNLGIAAETEKYDDKESEFRRDLWGNVYSLMRFFTFNQIVDIASIVTQIRNFIAPLVQLEMNELALSRTFGEEEIAARISIGTAIFAMACVAHFILSWPAENRGTEVPIAFRDAGGPPPEAGGRDQKRERAAETGQNARSKQAAARAARPARPKIGGAAPTQVALVLKSLIDVVVTSRSGQMRQVPGATSEWIKLRLVEAYKAVRSRAAFVADDAASPENRFAEAVADLALDPCFRYFCSMAGTNYQEAIKDARRKRIPAALGGAAGGAFDALMASGKLYATPKGPRMKRGLAAKAAAIWAKFVSERIFLLSPKHAKYVEWHDAAAACFPDPTKQRSNLVIWKARDFDAETERRWSKYRAGAPSRPCIERIYDTAGKLHRWTQPVLADGTKPPIAAWRTSWPGGVVDWACQDCGESLAAATARGAEKATEIRRAVETVLRFDQFFRFYELRCPAGGLHDPTGAAKGTRCRACRLPERLDQNYKLEYYKIYRTAFIKDRSSYRLDAKTRRETPAAAEAPRSSAGKAEAPRSSADKAEAPAEEFQFDIILAFSKKFNIAPKLFMALGGFEGQLLEDVLSGSFIPAESDHVDSTRIFVVNGYIASIFHEIGLIVARKPSSVLKSTAPALIPIAEAATAADLAQWPSLWQEPSGIGVKYRRQVDALRAANEPQKLLLFELQSLAEILLGLAAGGPLAEKYAADKVARLFKFEQLLTKPGAFSWSAIFGPDREDAAETENEIDADVPSGADSDETDPMGLGELDVDVEDEDDTTIYHFEDD